ncbi:MAG TPA: hypothetical protein DCS05_04235 [Nitrospiraceae bacterium]|nr:hypothetical protein [Nitrospiraceae bacterium]
MARIRYTGKEEKRIPGVGPVTGSWTPCPDHIAEEFKKEDGFVVDLAPPSESSLADHPSPDPLPLRGEDKKSEGKKIKTGGDV